MEVILRNVDGHDTHPHRLLHIAVNSSIKVGRASKAGSRNVQPAEDNAFIESPVISRDHASIMVKMDNNTDELGVFITDTGSMHGTYVDNEKLQKDVPFQLLHGSSIEFGASVYRNSETFHSRQYTATIRRWLRSPDSASSHGIFKVPDCESSEEEYESSGLDESDAESDTSAPEARPLHAVSIAKDTIQGQLSVQNLGAIRDMIPDSIGQNAGNQLCEVEDSDIVQGRSQPAIADTASLNGSTVARATSTRLRTPSTRQRSGTPIRCSVPEDNSENEEGQTHTAAFAPILMDDDAPSVGEREIPDSVSVASFSNSSISVEYLYPVDAPDMMLHDSEQGQLDFRSVSPSSSSSVPSEAGYDEQITDPVVSAPAMIGVESMSRITPVGVGERDQPVIHGHPSFEGRPTKKLDLKDLYIMGDTEPIAPSKAFSPTAVGGGTQDQRQQVQPMSLARILDSGSKEKPAQSSAFTPVGGTEFGIPPDPVSVNSLLNLSSEVVPDRAWKSAAPDPRLHMSTGAMSSSEQRFADNKSRQNWPSVPFDSLVDGPSVAGGQYREGPFAADYSNNVIYSSEPGLSAFDVPDVDMTLVDCYCPSSNISGKELRKAKTSISISDLVDASPVTPPSTGRKRKLKELDDTVSSQRPSKTPAGISTAQEGTVKDMPISNEASLSDGLADCLSADASHVQETTERPSKKKRVHAGSALLGAVLGGVGVFAALAFLPESLFQ